MRQDLVINRNPFKNNGTYPSITLGKPMPHLGNILSEAGIAGTLLRRYL